MEVSIAICDDDQVYLDIINEELIKAGQLNNIDIKTQLYQDGKQVIDTISKNKEQYDILFLDIDMPEISGFEVAKCVRDNGSDIILIFVSCHEQYVFDSFEYRPFKYIRKNRIKEEIEAALCKAYGIIANDNNSSFIAKTQTGMMQIKHKDIIYFEMYARKLTVYINGCGEKILTGRKTIKDISDELDDENFIQINSGCIVNVKYIEEYEECNIKLDNGKKLAVSRSRMKKIKESLNKYWRNRV